MNSENAGTCSGCTGAAANARHNQDPAKKCPGLSVARRLNPGFQELIKAYHDRIWSDGAIPLKYKYLMALATAVTGREPQRAMLEANKAIAQGVTIDEIRETLELCVWLGGSPLIVEMAGPVMRFAERRLAAGTSAEGCSGQDGSFA